MLELVGVVSGLTALASLLVLAYRFGYRLGSLETKVNVLWNIYVENMLIKAVRASLSTVSSLKLSEKGRAVLGEDLLSKVETLVRSYVRKYGKDEYLLLAKVISEVLPELRQRAVETGTDLEALLGAVILYIRQLLSSR